MRKFVIASVALCLIAVSAFAPNAFGQRGASLPRGWKRLGLSADQTKKVYEIRTTYRAKIQKLQEEITTLREEETDALMEVLTPDQKKLLVTPPTRTKAKPPMKQPTKGKDKQP